MISPCCSKKSIEFLGTEEFHCDSFINDFVALVQNWMKTFDCENANKKVTNVIGFLNWDLELLFFCQMTSIIWSVQS